MSEKSRRHRTFAVGVTAPASRDTLATPLRWEPRNALGRISSLAPPYENREPGRCRRYRGIAIHHKQVRHVTFCFQLCANLHGAMALIDVCCLWLVGNIAAPTPRGEWGTLAPYQFPPKYGTPCANAYSFSRLPNVNYLTTVGGVQ